MKVAFLNLCHCDPDVVARVSKKLLKCPDFDMYIHVDKKSDISPFQDKMKDCSRVYFTKNRVSVYWGSYSAIEATLELMRTAINSGIHYDRFVLFQNLDYPIKSNEFILQFFEKNKDVEFIRGCKIAKSKDPQFCFKYKLYHDYESPFYKSNKSFGKKLVHGIKKLLQSLSTIGFDGVIKDGNEKYPLYYGAAQWALTNQAVSYILEFEKTHPGFNHKMKHIQFPDEEYFHTIIHNSEFKYKCFKYDEPVQRWLVNWRNLHYFEFPKEVTVFGKEDFDKLMLRRELFCRKVRTGVSDSLMDLIDKETE